MGRPCNQLWRFTIERHELRFHRSPFCLELRHRFKFIGWSYCMFLLTDSVSLISPVNGHVSFERSSRVVFYLSGGLSSSLLRPSDCRSPICWISTFWHLDAETNQSLTPVASIAGSVRVYRYWCGQRSVCARSTHETPLPPSVGTRSPFKRLYLVVRLRWNIFHLFGGSGRQ